MTRAMCSRISKRKHLKPSQEVIPDNRPSKENSLQTKRNILGDKTNSPITRGSKTIKKCDRIKTDLNKNKDLTRAVSQENHTSADKSNRSKLHVPVYKSIESSDSTTTSCSLPLEKKESVYEFDEVDENEEPVKNKKTKKRTYKARKPKIGPKALTINNIKYSSTESLVSLPEKPARKKKTKPKIAAPYIKPYMSVNNLNESENTNYSVQSFMSHPPSVLLCDNRQLRNKRELSVLQETQSEECQSPIRRKDNPLDPVENQTDMMVNFDSVKIPTALPNDCRKSQDNLAVSQQRCYPSKRSLSSSNTGHHGTINSFHASINDTLPNHGSRCSANMSTSSVRDFLSSTPCKRISLVVRHNSVFDDSVERDIPVGLRPSTGFIRETPQDMAIEDECFGFDEPEELEEPLVSPIKSMNVLDVRKPRWNHHELSNPQETESNKLNVKDVIKMLKSTIPKVQPTMKSSEVFNNSDSSSPEHSNTASPDSNEVETTLSFTKLPRRSYERQRRIRHYSEHEEDDSDNEERDDTEEKENKIEKVEQENTKPVKRCYQKKNVSKLSKAPKVPKAKQRILKEEEELERLAAQMNAQFLKIDKCSLVVE